MDKQQTSVPQGSYLSKRGYVIKKDSITSEEMKFLKNHLRATPLQDDKYANYNKEDPSYQIYTETKNKLYLPKMYGTSATLSFELQGANAGDKIRVYITAFIGGVTYYLRDNDIWSTSVHFRDVTYSTFNTSLGIQYKF